MMKSSSEKFQNNVEFSSNRRTEYRYPTNFSALIAYINEDKYLNCCFKNISRSGFYIECSHTFSANETVQIILPFQYLNAEFQKQIISATIIWHINTPCSANRVRFGGKFLISYPDQSQIIDRILLQRKPDPHIS